MEEREMIMNKRFSAALRHWVKVDKKTTQINISKITGLSPTTISQIVKEKKGTSEESRRAIASVLGFTVEEMLSHGDRILRGLDPIEIQAKQSQQPEKFNIEEAESTMNQMIGFMRSVSSEIYAWKSVLEALPHGIIIVKPDKEVVYANRAYRQIMGENPTGKKCSDQIFCNPKNGCIIDRVIGDGLPDNKEIILNGKIIKIDAHPLFHRGGEVDSVILIAIDITEAKRIEEEREELIVHLREAGEMLNRGIVVTSKAGKVIYYNANFEKYAGTMNYINDVNQLKAQWITKLKNPQDFIDTAEKARRDRQSLSVNCVLIDGRKVIVSLRAMKNAEGKFLGMLGIITPNNKSK